MICSFKKTPRVIIGYTKAHCLSQLPKGIQNIEPQNWTRMEEGNNGPIVTWAANLIKVRPKWKSIGKRDPLVRKGKTNTLVRKGSWTLYLYKFTEAELTVLNCRVKQNLRNFELVKK